MAKFKTTYKYKGIEFASTSKVVAKKASQGDMRGAYQKHLSNTIIRQMTKADMSPAVRSSWMNSLTEGIKTEDEAKEALRMFKILRSAEKHEKRDFNQARRDIIETAETVGMSKKRISSLKYQLYRKGMTLDEAQDIVNQYIRDKGEKIRENIFNQYQGVFDQLRASDDPDVRQVIKTIEDIIDKWVLLAKSPTGEEVVSMTKQIKNAMEGMLEGSASDKVATSIENALDAFNKIETQRAIRLGFQDSSLKE